MDQRGSGGGSVGKYICLPCKHEELSSNPESPCKGGHCSVHCNPSAPNGRKFCDTHEQLVWYVQWRPTKRPYLKGDRSTPEMVLWLPHACSPHTQTHRETIAYIDRQNIWIHLSSKEICEGRVSTSASAQCHSFQWKCKPKSRWATTLHPSDCLKSKAGELCWQGHEVTGALVFCWWYCQVATVKISLAVLQKVKHRVSVQPSNFIPR